MRKSPFMIVTLIVLLATLSSTVVVEVARRCSRSEHGIELWDIPWVKEINRQRAESHKM